MTKSALEASRLIDRWENGLSISDHDAISVARALLRLSSERDELVERVKKLAAEAQAYIEEREAGDVHIAKAIAVGALMSMRLELTSLLSKPQEGGER